MINLYLRRIAIFFSLLFLLWGINSNYAEARESHSGLLITDFDIVEDKAAKYNIQTVSAPDFADQFQHYKKNTISMGITQSVYWVRFILPDDPAEGMRRLLEFSNSNFSKIDVYIPVPSQDNATQYRVKKVGTFRPFTNNDVLNNDWVVAVPPDYDQGKFVYLRLETVSVFQLPVSIWTEKDFFAQALVKNLGYGIFYGMIMAMFLYNLIVLYILKDKAYLFYVLYIVATFLYQFENYGYLRLLVDLAYPFYRGLFWLSLSLAFVSSIFFTGFFLRVHRDERIWFRLFASLFTIAVLEGILGMAGCEIWANQIAHGLGVALPGSFITLAFIRFRQGYHPARFYLLAWGVLAVGVLLWTVTPHEIWGVNELMVATVAEMLLLSLALSDRFNQIRRNELLLTQHIDHYKDLCDIDELTSLCNRRSLNRKMSQAVETAARDKQKLSVMMLDIDFFKRYNDNYGHWQGDQVLIHLGSLLLSALEDSKMVFRYGGEEFLILVPDIGRAEAIRIAEQIRSEFANQEFTPLNNQKVSVTLSIGITDLRADDTIESLFERADRALYYAKEHGRNQVVEL